MPNKLDKYVSKRKLDETPEPKGEVTKGKSHGIYVIQKHDATRLHYDFRLEHDGVLLSWAVPKGPSLDPTVKRLAVHVEDHPVSYARFEGAIPEGNYGAGTVLVWDIGTWSPLGDVDKMMKEGALKFSLQGERLQGTWALIKMHTEEKQDNWLLIKEHDDFEREGKEAEIVDRHQDSVLKKNGH